MFQAVVGTKKPHGDSSQWTKKTKDKVVKFENAIQKRTKASVSKFLGVGSRGIAFALSNGNVLKLTDDRTEASASATLKGKSLKNVVSIYDVFQLGELPIYGIVQERIKPLKSSYKRLVTLIWSYWYDDDKRATAIKAKHAGKVLSLFEKNLVKRSKHTLGFLPRITTDDISLVANNTNSTKQLLNGLLELAKNNIVYVDVDIENVGIASDGVFKIFDLGYSRVPVVAAPAIKEAKRFAGLKLWAERVATNS